MAAPERVIHELVVRHEPPPGHYAQQPPLPERRRSWPLMLVYAIGLAGAVVLTVWALAFAGREPSQSTRPPWRQGSEFNVGPRLDGTRPPQRRSDRQEPR